MGRKVRTLLPVHPKLLVPDYPTKAHQQGLQARQKEQHKHGDQHTSTLKPLKLGQQVWFWLNNKWTLGEITAFGPEPRSFIVQGNGGGTYRRNRYHLREAHLPPRDREAPPQVQRSVEDLCPLSDLDEDSSRAANVPCDTSSGPTTSGHTRSGRQVRPPNRMNL